MELINKYFEAFSNKDLDTLGELLDKDIWLTDWTASVRGKDNVLKFNEELFSKFSVIIATPVKIYGPTNVDEDQDYVSYAIEVAITLIDYSDVHTYLTVIDQIDIVDNKIMNITAYKKN